MVCEHDHEKKQVGLSKHIRLDLVKKFTKSGHTVATIRHKITTASIALHMNAFNTRALVSQNYVSNAIVDSLAQVR